MKKVERRGSFALALALALGVGGCGDDDGGDSSGGGSSAGAGGNVGGPTGCTADPDVCSSNMVCCEGNPYPPEGQCYKECELFSDRAIKHDVRPVDGEAVLETLAAMPVTRWRYDASPGTQHMGPMAQDFHQAFGLGETDRRIAAVDANGVSMAAIQALYHRVEALRVQSERLERENAALRLEVAELKATSR